MIKIFENLFKQTGCFFFFLKIFNKIDYIDNEYHPYSLICKKINLNINEKK